MSQRGLRNISIAVTANVLLLEKNFKSNLKGQSSFLYQIRWSGENF